MYRIYIVSIRYLQGILFFRLMSPGESHKEEELSLDEIFLNKIRDYVIKNISSENFSLQALVRELCYSRSQVHKKLKKITGKSLSAFVREVRLEEALKLLKAKAGTASEIAYRTGFSSPAYFNRCFNDYFGMTPGEAGKQEIQKPGSLKAGSKQGSVSNPAKRKLKISYVILAVLLVAVIVLLYPKILKRDTLEKLGASGTRVSVAVMPFKNMTNDTTWNIWQKGIQDQLISYLTNSEEFKVRQFESVGDVIQGEGITNYASLTLSVARKISEKLDANVFITGSIVQAGESLRLSALLNNTKTNEILKSFQIDEQYNEDIILDIIDSLSMLVNNYLVISVLHMEKNPSSRGFPSNTPPEAYRKFIQGKDAHLKSDWPTARMYFMDAIEIDSNYIDAIMGLTWAYSNPGIYEEAKKWCLKLYSKRNQMNRYDEAMTDYIYAWNFETPREEIKAIRQLIEIDDHRPGLYRLLGLAYKNLFEYEQAINEYEKGLDLFNKWDLKPENSWIYTDLGRVYHKTGQYRKEAKLYKKGEKDFPDDVGIIQRQAIVYLTESDTTKARQYIDKYIFIRKENGVSEAALAGSLALMYEEAGILDKAEGYFRMALSLQPEDRYRMRALARFLIDNNRDIDEGLELINTALALNPDECSMLDKSIMLDTKGWGLYKQGRYQEALEFLQKSRDLLPAYGPEIYLHLEAAKKAVASL